MNLESPDCHLSRLDHLNQSRSDRFQLILPGLLTSMTRIRMKNNLIKLESYSLASPPMINTMNE